MNAGHHGRPARGEWRANCGSGPRRARRPREGSGAGGRRGGASGRGPWRRRHPRPPAGRGGRSRRAAAAGRPACSCTRRTRRPSSGRGPRIMALAVRANDRPGVPAAAELGWSRRTRPGRASACPSARRRTAGRRRRPPGAAVTASRPFSTVRTAAPAAAEVGGQDLAVVQPVLGQQDGDAGQVGQRAVVGGRPVRRPGARASAAPSTNPPGGHGRPDAGRRPRTCCPVPGPGPGRDVAARASGRTAG